MTKLYNDYSSYIKTKFGQRVQKISVNAGFTCPNRDGSKGRGGCIYCDNTTFNPAYSSATKSISQQLLEGIAFFKEKYPIQEYIAYFQSYSNTYASVDVLKKLFDEAIATPGIIGLAIATRPDCINKEIIDLLSDYAKKLFVVVEFGIESTLNKTLQTINRCHTWEESKTAIKMTATAGIPVCVHVILGLPGEINNDFILHAQRISELPVHFIKLHQLQVIKNTTLADYYLLNPDKYRTYTVDEYASIVCEFLEYLSPKIVVERFTSESPPEKVIAPKWGRLKNFEVTEIIRKKLDELGTFQGRLWDKGE
ncbi:MAG: TIGR01212 family radical SAM protein [Bacteroidetes bacterium HGW-Bacteroidetes-21]|jgi:hypothetical protein|nr:MAG: TIGR01212 family radical SAM protein [Bacteroidetes bacterium HGW-Bacteroidetes-21]